VLQRLGFGNRWRAWVTALISAASSAVFVNGSKGKFFRHGRGLRQGDPLSPLLFVLAIDPLQKMFDRATQIGLLQPVQHRVVKLWVSLYADDAALFLNPNRQEIQGAMQILAAFAQASGLVTNFAKCAIYPVACTSVQLEGLLDAIPCEVKNFPCQYLGLPLHTRALRKIDVQPLIDRIASKLPAWKAKFLDHSGRLTLVNSVLTSMPVHFMTVFVLKKMGDQEDRQYQKIVSLEGGSFGKWGSLSGSMAKSNQTKNTWWAPHS
jgi:hypothetical protein